MGNTDSCDNSNDSILDNIKVSERPIADAGYGETLNKAIDRAIDSVRFFGHTLSKPYCIKLAKIENNDLTFIRIDQFGWCLIKATENNNKYRVQIFRTNIQEWIFGEAKTVFISIN